MIIHLTGLLYLNNAHSSEKLLLVLLSLLYMHVTHWRWKPYTIIYGNCNYL